MQQVQLKSLENVIKDKFLRYIFIRRSECLWFTRYQVWEATYTKEQKCILHKFGF